MALKKPKKGAKAIEADSDDSDESDDDDFEEGKHNYFDWCNNCLLNVHFFYCSDENEIDDDLDGEEEADSVSFIVQFVRYFVLISYLFHFTGWRGRWRWWRRRRRRWWWYV